MDPVGNDEHNLDLLSTPQPEIVQPSRVGGFFGMHPYTWALGGAALLIVAGAFIIVTRSPVQSSSAGTVAWGGTGALTSSYAAPNTTDGNSESILEQVQNGPPYNYILPTPQESSTDATDTSQSGGFDFNAFISMLAQENGTTTVAQDSSVTNSAYAFIPTGLVSIETPKKRTALQNSLYQYGNDVGSYIQSFEQENPNESQVLWDQAQDRTDAGKAAALTQLAQSLSSLGTTLAQMDGPDQSEVPSQLVSAHDALAKSYQDLGTKLALVPKTQSDADFVAAVNAYDVSAQAFTKNYVNMANLFVAYGVTFASGDPGSVFTFTQTAL